MALTKWQPPVLRHLVGDDGDVVWLELYFDLVYVAALIQVGDRLADDVSWRGVAEFAAVFGILWWTWTGTTAFMNRFAVDDILHRLLVFVQMFAVGSLALVVVSPIESRSSWMVAAYVAARLPLILMYARVKRDAASREVATFYQRVFIVGSAAWIASLALPTPARYIVWAAALLFEFAGPVAAVKRIQAPPANEEHFRERYALFTIIVLGESFVKTLGELADRGLSVQTHVFGGLTFVIGIAIWWTYFDDVADSTIRPRRRHLVLPWVYAHLPLAMATTALGVASKKMVAISAFDASIKASYLWLLVGSVATILLATAILDAVTVSPHFAIDLRLRIIPRVVAALLLVLTPVVLGTSPAALVLATVAAIAVGQIAFEVTIATKAEHRIAGVVEQQVTDLAGSCAHLERMQPMKPRTSGCVVCEDEGVPWVELRVCLACGVVGCCDDSPGRHTSLHVAETGHTAIASIEPGATWAYCYDDDVVMADWRRSSDSV